jgi:hypothetical protein
MIDVTAEISAVRREVRGRVLEAGKARVVTVSRSYPAELADGWDACTNPERIPRWFLPVRRELKEGGRYQLEGNAGGHRFLAASSGAWYEASVAFGTNPAEARAAADRTTTFYTGMPEPRPKLERD